MLLSVVMRLQVFLKTCEARIDVDYLLFDYRHSTSEVVVFANFPRQLGELRLRDCLRLVVADKHAD